MTATTFGRFDFADSDGRYALTWWYLNKLSIALKATNPAPREAREPATRGGGRETGKSEARGPTEVESETRAIKQISNFPFSFFSFFFFSNRPTYKRASFHTGQARLLFAVRRAFDVC